MCVNSPVCMCIDLSMIEYNVSLDLCDCAHILLYLYCNFQAWHIM